MPIAILRRVSGYQVDGILFQKGVPNEVDDALAAKLADTGYFDIREATADNPFPGITTRADYSPPKNVLGAEDLTNKKILLRRLGGIGDSVFVVTCAQEIKRRYPTASVSIAVGSAALAEFVGTFDCVNEAVTLDRSSKSDYIEQFDYIVSLNGVIEDRVIDDCDYFRAHWDRLGFTESVPDTFAPLGVTRLANTREAREQADAILRQNGFGDEPYAVLLLGTSNPLKKLHPNALSGIAHGLASGAPRLRVLCLGAGNDRTFKTQNQWIAFNLDLPLLVSAELVRRSRLTLGVDTGLMQYAAAIGVPTVSYWGPTDPALSIAHYPGPKVTVSAGADVCNYAPCRKLRAAFCPYFQTYPQCMRNVDTASLVSVAKTHYAAHPEHFALAVGETPEGESNAAVEASRPASYSRDRFNVAVLLDHAHQYTGGGFYLWQLAKVLAERPGSDVWVMTDCDAPVYVGDLTEPIQNLHVVKVPDLSKWTPGSFQFDLIVAQPPNLGGVAVEAAKRCDGKSALVVYETPNYIKLYREGADGDEAYWADYRAALLQCDHVWVISRTVKAALKEWLGDDFEKGRTIETLFPPIDSVSADAVMTAKSPLPGKATTAEQDGRTNSVVLIARHMRYKRLSETVEQLKAFAATLPERLDIHVVGAGSGKLFKALLDQPVPDRTNFKLYTYDQPLPEADKWRLLRQAKAYVHPSDFEGFGIPLAEALYACTPVVAKPLAVFKECFSETPFYYTSNDELQTNLKAIWDAWDDKGAKPKLVHFLKEGRLHVKQNYTLKMLKAKFASLLKRGDFTEVIKKAEARSIASVRGHSGMRVALVTSWGNRCGIAETTRQIADKFNCIYKVFAPKGDALVQSDDNRVVRCWDRSFAGKGELLNQIVEFAPHVVHVEHEFSFHSGLQGVDVFVSFLNDLKERGIKVTLTLHTFAPSNALDRIAEVCDTVVLTKPLTDETLDRSVVIPLPVVVLPPLSKAAARSKVLSWDGRERYLVGTFGLWNAHKGFCEVLDTYNEVQASMSPTAVHYGLVGHGDTRNQYMSDTLRKHRGLREKGHMTIWPDFLPMPDVLDRLYACDLLVYNYSVAGYSSASAAIRTGMSSGRPIICTHSPMFSEFKHEEHVLKVQFGETEELSKAICRVLRDPDLGERLAANCTRYISDCSPEHIAQQHEKLWASLLDA